MKPVNILLSGLLMFSMFASAQQVVISGKFRSVQKDFNIEDISAFQYLKTRDEKLIVKTDTGGNFSIRFILAKPGYYRIGRNILYLSPGNKLEIDINHLSPEKSAFKGRGSEANNFLKATPFPKGGSYLESGRNINADPATQLKLILSAAALRAEQLKYLKGVSDTFRILEAARIKSDVINSISSVRYYAQRKLNLSPDSARNYIRRFEYLSAPTINKYKTSLIDARFLQLVVFRDIASQILKSQKGKTKVQQQSLSRISDWLTADSLVKLMAGMEDKSKIKTFSSQLNTIKSPDFRKAAFKIRESKLRYGNGDLARDFRATDMNGKLVRLADLKGKIIFIDLWATWCGPCLAEMPAFEKLKAQYSDNDRIVFISLSIDELEESWRKNLKQRNASGLQWHISRSELMDYQIINIPRTIIIDENFKIANFQAPVPSSKENIVLLQKLLKTGQGDEKFSINGKFSDADPSGILFLSYQGKNGANIRDSVPLDKGTFHFEGTVEGVQQAHLLLSHAGVYAVKKNSDLSDIYIGRKNLMIAGKDSIATAMISGDRENESYQKLRDELAPLQKGQRALLNSLTPDNRKDSVFIRKVKQKNQDFIIKQKSLERAFILSNPDLVASIYILRSYAGPLIDVADVGPLYKGLSARVQNTDEGLEFAKAIEVLTATSVGQQAPDFTLPDSSFGKQVSLSDFRGKYVLLDFWASWCAPCRAENPNIIVQYKKYKEKNFEILGVSLDASNSRAAWLKAIKDDDISWTNVSSLNGFESIAAKLYHIEAIPQNFLIDPSGKIVAKNLRGESLNNILKQFISQ
ncbi:redoxin domain-containing protein [Pedobacter sp. BG31]|uniref:redoxin domain-containing protein n=1 Tax=Pedobacter sp. BG31 TaxID=3349697 RepID=UPI0035F39532